MRESVTYQAILDEGRVEELHRTILRQGHERFGEATEATRQQIETITNLDMLEELTVRLLHVATWVELLSASD